MYSRLAAPRKLAKRVAAELGRQVTGFGMLRWKKKLPVVLPLCSQGLHC
jgi:hypothetical protein